MEPEIKEMNEETTPKPGTKAALEAENAELRAQVEALMAERKTPNPAATGAPAEEQHRMVTIKLPKVKKDQEDVFVRVNRRTYLIKRGVNVEVPWFVAEVLQHQEEMLEVIMEFDEQHKNIRE